jgi:hypothetical protein
MVVSMTDAPPVNSSALKTLLWAIDLLPGKDDESAPAKGPFKATEPEFQVLKAGATALTKWITRVVTAAGGLSVAWAAVQAYLTKSDPALQIALVASAAFVIGAAAVSLALVIGADVAARAIATAGQYQARGKVAAVYEAAATGPGTVEKATQQSTPATVLLNDLSASLLAVAASGAKVKATLKADGQEGYITGVRFMGGNLEVHVSQQPGTPTNDDDWVQFSEIDGFSTER